MKTYVKFFALLFVLSLTSCDKLSHAAEEVSFRQKTNKDVKEKEINPEMLPQVIKDDIAARYPGSQLLEADEITQKDGTLTYDVEIKHENKKLELMYDAAGNFLGLEADDNDDDENDGEHEDGDRN
jgi:uncharacterized membrane protein YkoI